MTQRKTYATKNIPKTLSKSDICGAPESFQFGIVNNRVNFVIVDSNRYITTEIKFTNRKIISYGTTLN